MKSFCYQTPGIFEESDGAFESSRLFQTATKHARCLSLDGTFEFLGRALPQEARSEQILQVTILDHVGVSPVPPPDLNMITHSRKQRNRFEAHMS